MRVGERLLYLMKIYGATTATCMLMPFKLDRIARKSEDSFAAFESFLEGVSKEEFKIISTLKVHSDFLKLLGDKFTDWGFFFD